MPEYSDIYVISDKRDRKTIDKFLRDFIPNREECADEYEIPQFSAKPVIVFKKADELIDYCEKNKNTEHAIYWRSIKGSRPEYGMVFYLSDGYVIYGLSTDATNQKYAMNLLEEMKEYFGSGHGYIGHEASPDVDSYTAFLKQEAAHQS